MKLKTDIEIKALAKESAGEPLPDKELIAQWKCYIGGYEKGYTQAQQDLLASASSGFSEFWDDGRYLMSVNYYSRDYVAERIWQTAKLSSAEEINFLKATNARLEEARVSHLKESERLQKENEELKKENEELKQELLLSKPLYSQRKLEERIKEAEEIIVSWNEYLKRENELASKIGTVADDYIAKWNLLENTDSSKEEVK